MDVQQQHQKPPSKTLNTKCYILWLYARPFIFQWFCGSDLFLGFRCSISLCCSALIATISPILISNTGYLCSVSHFSARFGTNKWSKMYKCKSSEHCAVHIYVDGIHILLFTRTHMISIRRLISLFCSYSFTILILISSICIKNRFIKFYTHHIQECEISLFLLSHSSIVWLISSIPLNVWKSARSRSPSISFSVFFFLVWVCGCLCVETELSVHFF